MIAGRLQRYRFPRVIVAGELISDDRLPGSILDH
jgi:hypothetical protein